VWCLLEWNRKGATCCPKQAGLLVSTSARDPVAGACNGPETPGPLGSPRWRQDQAAVRGFRKASIVTLPEGFCSPTSAQGAPLTSLGRAAVASAEQGRLLSQIAAGPDLVLAAPTLPAEGVGETRPVKRLAL
jgi:hypothetical protein